MFPIIAGAVPKWIALIIALFCGLVVFVLYSWMVNFFGWLFGHLLSPPQRPPSPPPPTPIAEPEPPAEDVDGSYPANWATIARKAKTAANWRCQQCHLSLLSDKNLLHVHHRDRNPQNNSDWNLQVLCVQCHSLEEGPGHKRLAGAIKTDGRLARILALRRWQSG